MKKIVTIFILMGLFAGFSFAQGNNPVHVRFAKGTSDAAITKTIKAGEKIDFDLYGKQAQTMSFTIGYDFNDMDVEAFLLEPGHQKASLTTGPKSPNEFKLKKSGKHRISVRNKSKKKITITLYVGIE